MFPHSRGQEGNPNPVIGRAIKIISAVLLFVVLLTVFWQGFWTWGSGYPPRCPYSTVRKSMPGVRSAGRVGGQATQPGSTRTPSPSVQPGGITPPGSGATMASRHRHKGQTVKLRGNPEGQRYRPGVATSYGHHVVAWG